MPDKMKWVKEWFRKGDNDLKNAEIVIQSDDPPTDTICFHAQQCAEKYLKGFLTLHDIAAEKTHDLVVLNNLCCKIDQEFGNIEDFCEQLTGYSVEVRYPVGFYDYTVDEAKEALEIAGKIRRFVLKKVENVLSDR